MKTPWQRSASRLRHPALWLGLAIPLHFFLMGISACETDADGDGISVEDGDCDDTNPANFPGNTELCDGGDNDFDGLTDEELSEVPEACDSLDNNCDGTVDEGFSEVAEVCDNVDNNCNGTIDDGLEGITHYADIDVDGYGDPNVSAPGCVLGYVLDNTDCNDANAGIYPGHDDTFGDLIDSNCNGLADWIDTAAGGGSLIGDGNLATIASLDRPLGVAADGVGHLFIADTNHNRVRRVDLATGVISTVAGSGDAGYGGDGGPATDADLSAPSDLAVDAAGNLFIVDRGNHRVRKVTASTGVIATVAGIGTGGYNGDNIAATTAQLNDPQAVSLDGRGNFYISDSGNHRIRKVTPGGTISTAAGSGVQGYSGDGALATAAQLNAPAGITFDVAFNLYIADSGNHRIRRVSNTTGNIATIIGNGTQGYAGDGAQAINAQLNSPRAVMIDGSGNVFVSDAGNHAVRRVAINGIIATAAGDGTAGFEGDGGVGLDARLNAPSALTRDEGGNVYVADSQNGRVRRLDLSLNISTTAGVGGAYTGDGGIATLAVVDSRDVAATAGGDLFIASGASIRHVDASTGMIHTLVGVTGAMLPAVIDADAIARNSAGDLFIAGASSHTVQRIDAGLTGVTLLAGTGTSGYSGDGGPATAAQLSAPRGVAVDGGGNVYIADVNNHRIRKIDTAGVISTYAGNGRSGYGGDNGPATLARLYLPQGVEYHSNTLIITDTGNNRIRKVTSAGVISTIVGTGVYGYGGDGGPATAATVALPTRTVHGVSGDLYIADTGNNRIRRVDSAGNISTVAGTGSGDLDDLGDNGPAIDAALIEPSGLAIDDADNIYVTQGGVGPRVRVLIP